MSGYKYILYGSITRPPTGGWDTKQLFKTKKSAVKAKRKWQKEDEKFVRMVKIKPKKKGRK